MSFDKEGWWVAEKGPDQESHKEPTPLLSEQAKKDLADARQENLTTIEHLDRLRAISPLSKLSMLAVWRGLMPGTNVVFNFDKDVTLGVPLKGHIYETADAAVRPLSPLEKRVEGERARVKATIDVADEFGLKSAVGNRFVGTAPQPFRLESWQATDIHETIPAGGIQLLHVGYDEDQIARLQAAREHPDQWHRPAPSEYKSRLMEQFLPEKPIFDKVYSPEELRKARLAVETVKILDPSLFQEFSEYMKGLGIREE